ncbi:MAG: hypothetical protein MR902_07755 [Campylobacter sp.]|nr:hypothetical protein [Campylobacter sp.]
MEQIFFLVNHELLDFQLRLILIMRRSILALIVLFAVAILSLGVGRYQIPISEIYANFKAFILGF